MHTLTSRTCVVKKKCGEKTAETASFALLTAFRG
jgi:hypothetical protein